MLTIYVSPSCLRLLGCTSSIKKEEINHIINIAYPVISLYQPAIRIISPLLSLHHFTTLGLDIKNVWDKKEINQELFRVTYNTTLCALSIINPQAAYLIDLCVNLARHIYSINHELNKKTDSSNEIIYHVLHVANCIVSMSIYIKPDTPEFLMVSYLIKAIQRSIAAFKEYKNSNHILFIVNVASSLLNLDSFHHFAEISYRNKYGKTVTQEDLDIIIEVLKGNNKDLKNEVEVLKEDVKDLKNELEVLKEDVKDLKNEVEVLKEVKESKPIQLEKITEVVPELPKEPSKANNDWISDVSIFKQLKKLNFKNELKDLTVEGKNFDNVHFKDVRCENVIFKHIKVNESIFEGGFFKSCEFTDVSFSKCKISDMIFSKCKFNDLRIEESLFNRVCFENFNFERFFAKDVSVEGSVFGMGNIMGSHFVNVIVKTSKFYEILTNSSRFEQSEFSAVRLYKCSAVGTGFSQMKGDSHKYLAPPGLQEAMAKLMIAP